MSTGLIAYSSKKGFLKGFYLHEGEGVANRSYTDDFTSIISGKGDRMRSFCFDQAHDKVICPLNLLKWS